MSSSTRVHILNKLVGISHSANTEKGTNQSIISHSLRENKSEKENTKLVEERDIDTNIYIYIYIYI